MYYFISDLHLNEFQPEISQRFLQFMQQQAREAQAVYILGDLFEFWIGDDEDSLFVRQIKQAILALTQQGTLCYFICGNRDFLLGERFAQETGIILLPDYYVTTIEDKRILLCHGDTLCTDDINYQKFRYRIRQKWLQRLFCALPLAIRIKIAQNIRHNSQQSKQQKSAQMMDVNRTFTAQIAEKFEAQWLIHGHIHKQAVYVESYLTQAKHFTRMVLGDWGKDYMSILKIEQGKAAFL